MQLTNNYWKSYTETVYAYSNAELARPGLSPETVHFLKDCGLPSDCEPCLAFDKFVDPRISTVNEVFGTNEKELDNYLMIGTNGSGDPVCIDVAHKNEIVYLNHDQGFERIFINASILHFAQCLVKYQDFLLSGESGGKKFSDEELGKLRSYLKKTDKRSLAEGSFWNGELEYLEWERERA